jgi:hypothetical protein
MTFRSLGCWNTSIPVKGEHAGSFIHDELELHKQL